MLHLTRLKNLSVSRRRVGPLDPMNQPGEGAIWTSLIQFGQVWSNFDKFDPIWESLIQFGHVWSSLDRFNPIWTCFIQFRQVLSNLDNFDLIWTSLFQFGQVWSNLDMFDPIWTSLIQFGQIMQFLYHKSWNGCNNTTMTNTRLRDDCSSSKK